MFFNHGGGSKNTVRCVCTKYMQRPRTHFFGRKNLTEIGFLELQPRFGDQPFQISSSLSQKRDSPVLKGLGLPFWGKLQYCVGDRPFKLYQVSEFCPQNGTAVLRGSIQYRGMPTVDGVLRYCFVVHLLLIRLVGLFFGLLVWFFSKLGFLGQVHSSSRGREEPQKKYACHTPVEECLLGARSVLRHHHFRCVRVCACLPCLGECRLGKFSQGACCLLVVVGTSRYGEYPPRAREAPGVLQYVPRCSMQRGA